MAVVVKIHEARVDYENADSFDLDGRHLRVWEGKELVGLHDEWRYAAVKPSQCKRGLVAEYARDILEICNNE